jgi:hypothetical protein
LKRQGQKMKTWWHLLIFFISAQAVSANATRSVAEPKSQQMNPSRAQAEMDSITRKLLPIEPSSATIGHIEALGLKPTASNVDSIRQLLSRKLDSATMASLVYLLGSLYVRNDQFGQNAAIARTLKSYILSGDSNVATAALLSYSRTDYQPDRIDLLDYGQSHNLLNEADYCRELALGLPFAPAPAQMAAATRLAAKDNPLGAEVLAMGIDSQAAATKISPEARPVLIAFLQKREPRMPMALGEFGMTDGIRYTYWLTAMAELTEADGKGSATAFILDKLSSPDTDPRKILGFLSSPEGARFVAAVGSRVALAQVIDRALLPARQFPGHPMFAPMGEEMTKTLSKLKN